MIISGDIHKRLKNIVISIIIVLIFFVNHTNISASPITDLKNQINSLQEQINQLNAAKKTLQKSTQNAKIEQQNAYYEIDTLNTKIEESKQDIEILEIEIKKSETEVDLTKEKIIKAESDINILDNEISSLLSEQKKRINNIYQNTRIKTKIDEFEVTIPTQVDVYISKTNYQKQLKAKGDGIFIELSNKKSQKEEEQKNIESQKLEQEKLLFALTDQRKSLENLKIELKNRITEQEQYVNVLGESINSNSIKSNEIEKQARELDDRISQLQHELFNSTNYIPESGTRVKAGDFIGYMGDTGYSTGPHLHFFLSKNGSGLLDPCRFLPTGVLSQCNYGNGEIIWPMNEVYWSRGFNYPDPGHGGIDIYAFNDTEIYAAHDGYLIRGKEQCYSWFPICKDGGANYVIICESLDCQRGFKTGYWHLK